MSETLSPSEIQSLFAGLDLAGGATGSPSRLSSMPEQTWAADQFTLPMALDGEELAALQAWQTAFGKSWSATWTDPFASRFTLQNANLKIVRLRDFVTGHAGWHGFQVTASQGGFPVWMALDDSLVAAHLDCLLGGTEPASELTARTLGPLEQQLTGRLVAGLSESLFTSQADAKWQIKPVNSAEDWIAGIPVYLSCEIVQFDFEIRGSGANGHLSLGIPRGACDKLSSFRAARTSTSASIPTAVQLRVTLPPIALSPTEFQELQVGDVLLTPQGDQAPCLVSCDGQPRFTASIGSHQGHKAIRLTAVIE
ncbi:MAG: flagellar motor switch protein FliM [Planctomycetaceae bacterium]|nr:flagellar motor switch protein FliM [Planctomycetaceae bacterium]